MYPGEHVDILRLDQTIQSSLAPVEAGDDPLLVDDSIPLSSSLKRRQAEWKASQGSLPDKNARQHFYLLDTIELIEEYKQTLQTPIKIRFVDTPAQSASDSAASSLEKQEIVQKFITTAKEYSTVDLSYTKSAPVDVHRPPRCTMCSSTEVTESTEFSGILICLECGAQETTQNLANSIRLNHNDSKRVNICSKYSYDKKSHFLNCINQYQGKHKSGIEPDILERIEAELERYHLIDHPRKTKRGKFRNVTKEHIFLFVKELKMTKCYGDINLIHHLITGFPLNDISHLTEKLLQDFDQFVQMHHKQFPNDNERKNFNYQHLLYQLLMRHKYPCNSNEFNFLKTVDRKYYHDEICRIIFENLGWNYSSLF
jgi:hypothetical protein